MSEGAEFRVVFVIYRRLPGDDDFTDIGFGSSDAERSLDQAAHVAQSYISSREWQTAPNMPDPKEVD